MALQKGTNSFVTVREADEYFEMRLNSESWFTNSSDKVEQALVTATGILNRMVWSGTSTPTTSYPLSWPRDIEYYEPITGDIELLTDDRTTTSEGTIPEDIKKATFELANFLLLNISNMEKNSNGENKVKDLTVGSVRMIFDINSGKDNFNQLPDVVNTIVKKYLEEGSQGSRGVFVSGGA